MFLNVVVSCRSLMVCIIFSFYYLSGLVSLWVFCFYSPYDYSHHHLHPCPFHLLIFSSRKVLILHWRWHVMISFRIVFLSFLIEIDFFFQPNHKMFQFGYLLNILSDKLLCYYHGWWQLVIVANITPLYCSNMITTIISPIK